MKSLLWGLFVAFFVAAVGLGWHDGMFSLAGPLGAGKLAVWAAFLGFLGYSIQCSARENIFKTIRTMNGLWWGRQIGLDLYLGLALTLFLIYLHHGGLVVALWLLPTLAFANLATLLYFSIYYDSLVARFVG